MKAPVFYRNFIFRITVSFFAALFLVMYGSGISLFQALLLRDFYISLLGSFVIAFILVHCVHLATIILDRKIQWEHRPIVRCAFQCAFGLFIPCVIAYLLAAIYFWAYGLNINEDIEYMTYDFPWVVIFLFGLNAYYLIRFFMLLPKININHLTNDNFWQPEAVLNSPFAAHWEESESGTNQLPPLTLYGHNQILSVDASESVAYFYCVDKHYWAKTKDGNAMQIRQTLSEIEDLYCGDDFFRINRQVILNRKIVSGYTTDKFGRCFIIFSKGGNQKPPNSPKDFFVISKNKVSQLIRWVKP